MPELRKRLLAVNGKNAKLLECQDRACDTETVSRTTNARCPVCHKRMEMIGKGMTYVCLLAADTKNVSPNSRSDGKKRAAVYPNGTCMLNEETAERGKRTGEFRICRCIEEYPVN